MSKQSMLSVFVEKAKQLKNAFRINGRPTDGTVDVDVQSLKSVIKLNLTPSDVTDFSIENVKGLSNFIVDANLLFPLDFEESEISDLIVLDNHVDKIIAMLVVKSTNSIYKVSGEPLLNQWTLVSQLADQRDIVKLLTHGVNKLTSPFILGVTGDAEGLVEINGANDVDLSLTLDDVFKGIATGVNEDPNTTTSQLIYTKHANAPTVTDGWIILSYRTSGAVVQIALSSGVGTLGIAARQTTTGTFQSPWIWLSNNKISSYDIPDLDASKVTAGVFSNERIPTFNTSKIVSGVFEEERIPVLDASKITTGTFDPARIPAFSAAGIPDLDANKITTGVFDEVRIPDLDANKVTTGVFDEARIPQLTSGKIPDMDASKINTGIFDEVRIPQLTSGKIPTLDASKITTGVFDPARIPVLSSSSMPSLDASKVTTGVFDEARIPVLSNVKIPQLDTSKITTGLFDEARIPSLPVSKVPVAATSNKLSTGRMINNALFDGSKDITTASWGMSRTLTLDGDVTGSVSQDGSENKTIIVSIKPGQTPASAIALGDQNLDTVIDFGFYVSQVKANCTIENNYPVEVTGSLTVTISQGITQVYTTYAIDGNNIYIRGFFSSTWTPWKQIVSSSNIGLMIPGLPASKITTGLFDEARIPTLSSAKIPNLDASKITSGLFDEARLPTIPVSKVPLSGSASVLATSRTINGTSFNGSADIVTDTWGKTRALTLSGDVTGTVNQNGSTGVTMVVSANASTIPSRSLELTTQNLNDVVMAGFYHTSIDANATLAKNYPHNKAGALSVKGTIDLVQTYITVGLTMDIMSFRTRVDNLWSGWRDVLDSGSFTGSDEDIDASKITSGILDEARLPTIPAGKIPSLDASKITTGVIPASRIATLNQSTTGTATNATKLSSPRTISITGDGTWSTTFDGSANVTSTLTLSNTGVTAGTYTKLTVDSKGRVTSATLLTAADIPTLAYNKITGLGNHVTHNYGTAVNTVMQGNDERLVNLTGDSSTGANDPDTITVNSIRYSNGTSAAGYFTDGAIYAQAYSSVYVHQIYGDYRSGNISVRGKNNGVWTPWSKVWTSSNQFDIGVSQSSAHTALALGNAAKSTLQGTTGQSTAHPMHQKAVTDALNSIATSQVTSGVFVDARIPQLAVGKVNNAVPDWRTINSKALTANVFLSAADVGAIPINSRVVGLNVGVDRPLYNTSGLEAQSTGEASTYPSISFHKAGVYAGNMAMTDISTYSFYKQDGTTLANLNGYINASLINQGTIPAARIPNSTATANGGLKSRISGTSLYLTNNGTNP